MKKQVWASFYVLLAATSFCAAAAGDNIARGRPYQWTQVPSYALCSPQGDTTDLTDGVYMNGGYHTENGCVGWQGGGAFTITLWVSTTVKPINRIAFRCNFSPAFIYIFVSSNGFNYDYVGDLISMSWQTGFPDDSSNLRGTAIGVHKYDASGLVLAGKYVKFVVYRAGGFAFCDEIEVYEGSHSISSYIPGPIQLTTATNFDTWATEHKYDGIVRVRLLRDIAELQKHALAGSYTTQINSLRQQVLAMPFVESVDMTHGVPYNDLESQIWALNGTMQMAAGYAQRAIAKAKLYDPVHPFDGLTGSASACEVDLIGNEKRAGAFNVSNLVASSTSAEVTITWNTPAYPASKIELDEVRFTEAQQRCIVASGLAATTKAGDNHWSVTLPAGAKQQFWVQFDSTNVLRGTYTGQISVTPQGGTAMTIPITVRVHRGAMGALPAMDAYTFDYVHVPSYGLITADNQKPIMQTLFDNYETYTTISPGEFCPSGGTRAADGSYIIEPTWTGLNKWLDAIAASGRAVRGYHVFLNLPGMESAYGGGFTRGTAEYTKAVQSFFLSLAKYLDSRGIDRRRFVLLVSDEPPFYSAIDQASADFTNIVKAAVPQFRFLVDPTYSTLGSIDQGGRNYIESSDIIMPTLSHMLAGGDELIGYYQNLCTTQGKELGAYMCSGGGLGRSPTGYIRMIPWQVARLGGKAIGIWAAAAQSGPSTWDDFRAQENYELVLATANSCDYGKLLAAWRDGVGDFEYFHIIEGLKAKAAGQGLGSYLLSYAANTMSATAASGVAAAENSEAWNYTAQNDAFDTAKLDLIEAIDILGSVMGLETTIMSDSFGTFDSTKWTRYQPNAGGATNVSGVSGGELVTTRGEAAVTANAYDFGRQEVRLNVDMKSQSTGDSFVARAYNVDKSKFIELVYNEAGVNDPVSLKRYSGTTLEETYYSGTAHITLPATLVMSVDSRNVEVSQASAGQSGVTKTFDTFETYSGSSVIGQGGWSGSGTGALTNSWGQDYIIAGNNSVYSNSGTIQKTFAAAGLSGGDFGDGTVISMLVRIETVPSAGNTNTWTKYWVNLYSGSTWLTTRFYANGTAEKFQKYVSGSGLNDADWADTGLGNFGTGAYNRNIYKIEFELNFTSQTVTFYGTDIDAGGPRIQGSTVSYNMGTASNFAANGYISLSRYGGAAIVDDIKVTAPGGGATSDAMDTIIFDGPHNLGSDFGAVRFALSNSLLTAGSGTNWDNAIVSTGGLTAEASIMRDCNEAIGTGFKLAGDINGDCAVNLGDIRLLADNWLGASTVPAAMALTFEAPQYTAGNSINGVDGWSVTGGSAIVTNTTILEGSQSAELTGATVVRAFGPNAPLNNTTELSWRMNLPYGTQVGFYLVEDFAHAIMPAGVEVRYGHIYSFSSPATDTTLTYTYGTTITVGMVLDFANSKFTIFTQNADGSNRQTKGPYTFWNYLNPQTALELGGIEIVTTGTVVADDIRMFVPTPANCQSYALLGYVLDGDVNGNCKADMSDFALIGQDWLNCNDPLESTCVKNWIRE